MAGVLIVSVRWRPRFWRERADLVLGYFVQNQGGRWLALDAEIKEHDGHVETLTAARAPELLAAHGMATGTAAEMLRAVGDNPERIHSEAAFAKLCGVCPITAPSGKIKRHRLNRTGNRQANAALYLLRRAMMYGPTRNQGHFLTHIS